ncbi:hypothetical protein HPB47_012737, partial [Ixodes persulcatus]
MVRSQDLDHHMLEFQAVLGFPNAIGALDGCHLPVSLPKDSAVDYRNYKGWDERLIGYKATGTSP